MRHIQEEETLKAEEFLQIFYEDSIVRIFLEKFGKAKNIQLKNCSGSFVPTLVALVETDALQVVMLNDREDAAYFYNDLKNLCANKEILFFPTSYKKPFQFEPVDNANVLQRAEVLNRINQNPSCIVVTYPDALSEKVINRKTLVANTFSLKVGEKIGTSFLEEVLNDYHFERSDFVYEPGQYAVRGGIVDIFSFANELPYRIEFFGDEIESIRTFNPETQLSVASAERLSIIPNVQMRLVQETREPFFDFIPEKSVIWAEGIDFAKSVVKKYADKANALYDEINEKTLETSPLIHPSELYDMPEEFSEKIARFPVVEFGSSLRKLHNEVFEEIVFDTKPQPSFNKNFNLLVENLKENIRKGFKNYILSDLPKQSERLQTIFEELDPYLQYEFINLNLHAGFEDRNLKAVFYTEHQIFERFHRYKLKEKYSKNKAITLKELNSLQVGDYVTHIDYGVARFAGLEKVENGGKEQESVRLVFRDNDLLYVGVHALHKITKFSGKEGTPPALSKLGSQEWDNKKKKAKARLKDIGAELIKLYAKRRSAKGFQFSKDTYLQAELESSFMYEDTPDQARATLEVKADMEKSYPMDRLICGDVGFGKTEIAIRAAFKAACDGKQVAVLVPTTILAAQHYRTFSERLKNLPVTVDYINRFRKPKDEKEILQKLEAGQIDIIIGTHKIVSDKIKFKDLGLLIIDEEQKFGVKIKDKLKEIKHNVDCLTMTATPIPRTLHFSLMGARDLSVINTPPPNRQPVTTEVHHFDEEVIRDAVRLELQRGGQVFFVHNRIGDIYDVAGIIARLVPDAKVTVAHGQMTDEKLEAAMMGFLEGEFDVLVSTNIIESGLDIPNANTIIINQAHNIGLSDLHQMRGRVGRSNRKAFCYLIVPSLATLTSDSRKRLQALEEYSELGDGFKISMRDLDIRGAGNLLGAEQSGFINELGFETYHKMLDEAIAELKEEEFRELFEGERNKGLEAVLSSDCNIETDFQILIPESYIPPISERLRTYIQIDEQKTEAGLLEVKKSLEDRFGKIPQEVEDLFKVVRLRWAAQRLGFEKLTLKNDKIRGLFVAKQDFFKSETFGKVLNFVNSKSDRCRLKESTDKRLLFIFENVKTIDGVMNVLKGIEES
jgi:transcription-repair coupling factor (superfamily II helicase)